MTIGPVLGVTLRFLLLFEGVEGEATPRPLPIRVRLRARFVGGCDAPASSCVSCVGCLETGGERASVAITEDEGTEAAAAAAAEEDEEGGCG